MITISRSDPNIQFTTDRAYHQSKIDVLEQFKNTIDINLFSA